MINQDNRPSADLFSERPLESLSGPAASKKIALSIKAYDYDFEFTHTGIKEPDSGELLLRMECKVAGLKVSDYCGDYTFSEIKLKCVEVFSSTHWRDLKDFQDNPPRHGR